jgi:hypothetical protein
MASNSCFAVLGASPPGGFVSTPRAPTCPPPNRCVSRLLEYGSGGFHISKKGSLEATSFLRRFPRRCQWLPFRRPCRSVRAGEGDGKGWVLSASRHRAAPRSAEERRGEVARRTRLTRRRSHACPAISSTKHRAIPRTSRWPREPPRARAPELG